ncbi:MAG: LamG domain-containing protein [Candidatus Lokiarchaeota archaeon]
MAELIGFWNCNAGTGTILIDNTGYNNTGTFEGSMDSSNWVQGCNIIDYALEFDGSADRIDLGNNTPLDEFCNGSYSISLWVKSSDSVPLVDGCILSKYEDSSNLINIHSDGANNALKLTIKVSGESDIVVTFDSAPFDESWHHIVILIDRNNDIINVFMDCVKDNVVGDLSAAISNLSNSGNLAIGAVNDGTSPYEGLIDEIRIYKGVLTFNEIRFLFLYPNGKQPSNDELKHYLIALWHLDLGVFTETFDSSKYHNHGTFEGGMTTVNWQQGISNYCLEFDGIDDRVDFGNPSPLDTLGSNCFSISLWYYATSVSGIQILFAKHVDSNNYIRIATNAGTYILFYFSKSGINTSASFTSYLSLEQWNHIVLVVDRINETVTGCFNNRLDKTIIDISIMPADCSNNGNVSIGALHDGTTPYEGKIDEVRIYNRLLSNSEISLLFKYPDGNKSIILDAELENSLINYLKLDRSTGLIAYDETEFENNGILDSSMTDSDWILGIVNNGLELDGIDDDITITNNFPISELLNGSCSFSFWIKSKDNTPLNYGCICSKYVDANNLLRINSNGTINQLRIEIGYSGTVINTNLSITPFDGLWHHVAIVINRTTNLILIYEDSLKDPIEIDISTLPNDCSNSSNLIFGSDGTNYFEGSLDEVRIYNRILTYNEIIFLYNNPNGLNIRHHFTAQDGTQLFIKSISGETLSIISDTDYSGDIMQAEITDSLLGGLDKYTFKLPKTIDIPLSLNNDCYFYLNSDLKFVGYIEEEPLRDQEKPILEIKGRGYFNRLKKIIINETFSNETLQYIVYSIGRDYLHKENHLNIFFNPYKIIVPDISSIDIEFKDKNLLEVFEHILSICNYNYLTERYRLFIDNDKDLVIKPITSEYINFLYEGYHFHNIELSLDDSKIVNKIKAYRTISGSPKEAEYVNTYEDTDSQSKYGVYQEKLIFSDYYNNDIVGKIISFLFAKHGVPEKIIKIKNVIFNDIVEFGKFIVGSKRELYWRTIVNCDSVTIWNTTNLIDTSIEVSNEHVLTGKKSLKLTTIVGSVDEYIEFTCDDVLYLPQIVRMFIFFEQGSPELEVTYYDNKSNTVTIDINASNLYNNQWIRLTEEIGQRTEEVNLQVYTASLLDFEVNTDISTVENLTVRRELAPGLLNISKIRLTIKSDISSIFYIDLFDTFSDIYNFHDVLLEEVKYVFSSVGLRADLNFGSKQENLIDEIEDKIDKQNVAANIFSKQ